ncbi:MAG: hypothetical protein ABJA82_01635 [Myxococcales bacterium]
MFFRTAAPPRWRNLLIPVACWLYQSACEPTPTVPETPTWANVEPILRGSCTHCHGATAAETGSAAGIAYRFDFYDMTAASCGEAAAALEGQTLARAWAALIATDVTSPGSGWRPRMPPAPADTLVDWERETLVRWATRAGAVKGEPRHDNRRPDIQLAGDSGVADQRLAFTCVVTDPDGEAVAGVLKVGDLSLKIDHAGAFAADIDTSTWPAGLHPVSAVICDGWDSVTYSLGNVEIKHAATK